MYINSSEIQTEDTQMTNVSFHKERRFWPIQLEYPSLPFYWIVCIVRKVSRHVYMHVLGVLILPQFLRFSNWIVGLLWGCCMFSFFILWLSGTINHVNRGFIAHLVLSVHYLQSSYVFWETLIYSFSHWFLCLILTH